MSKRYPQEVSHTDIEVRRHLAHLRHLHAQQAGASTPSNGLADGLKRPKKQAKTLTTIRLSPEVLAAFKATGKGWQTRIDKALREIVTRGRF